MLALIRAGVFEEGGPEELLDGEIWVMPAEGARHVDMKTWLNRQLVRSVGDDVSVTCDTTIRFSEAHWPDPDFALFPTSVRPSEARGPDMLLVIEIADTSLTADLKIKGAKYQEYGVREYWVVDLEQRVTHVHKLGAGWPEAPAIPFDAPVTPTPVSGVTLRLADCAL
ncbi:MAG: Uma2 family endonuclease [Hyphomonadaceae bacterium]|nr:Uma2 family endonuclease [Hyphomonadaceae bacterium]